MSGQHTKGPWHWRVSRKGKSVHLVAADGVGTFVMGFVRFGTQSAQPQFNAVGRMETAADLAVDIPGQEHNNTWNQTLAHPDARLIAAAPELFALAERVVESWWRYEGAFKVCVHCGGGAKPGEKPSSVAHDDRCLVPSALVIVAKVKGGAA